MKSLPVLFCLMTMLIYHTGLAQRTGAQSAQAPTIIVLGIDKDMNTRIGPPIIPPLQNPTATIDVTYIGFPGGALTAFQYAVDIWESLIASPVTIKVTARWTPLGTGVLGSASADGIWRDFGGGSLPGTWYPQALAEMLFGGSLNDADSADITANFNSTFPNWYFGTDGNPPSGQYDFVTVVLHELGHGLGFFGSMSVTSGTGNWGFGTGFPTIYDRFAENGSNQQLINTTIFPNPSTALGTQLTSNNIFFDGPNATPANGGTPPKLYCPATWALGSSFSHLNETTYPAGNPHSLMTPMVGTAEAIHSPGAVTLGMFEDWGWSTTPTSVDDGEPESPTTFVLSQNYPNPFNPKTEIGFQIAPDRTNGAGNNVGRSGGDYGFVSLRIFDMLGQEVTVLVNERLTPGEYVREWDAKDASSGVYLYRLESGGQIQTRKMVLLR